MAKNKDTEAVIVEEVTETPKQTEAVYPAKEIAKNAPELFGYSIDIATAALRVAKLEEATLDSAKKIIKAFAERKV